MRFRLLVQVIVVAVIAGGVGWVITHRAAPTAQQQQQQQKRGGGAIPVAVAEVAPSTVPITLTALGTVTPLASVTVKTQIAGQLTQVAYTEGQMVHKGDFLAQIDPRPYQAQLEQYLGQLNRDQAQLKAAEIDLDRYKTLVAEDSIARQQLDTQASLVMQYRGAVETDKALVANGRLNIAYCHIVAPITGRVGLRQVDQGNYVQTNDSNGLVIITQVQPITVVFTIPEDSIPELIKRYRSGAVLPVTAFDRSATAKLAEGKVLTVDNQIDSATGTVKVKALFENQDEALFPNQFVNVKLNLNTLENVPTVPSAAVLRGAPGTFVYVVGDGNTVAVRPVKVGPTAQNKTAILDGLNPGDRVVVDGTDKLRDGASISIPTAENGQKRDKHE